MLRVRPATAADYPAFQRFWVELAIEQPTLDVEQLRGFAGPRSARLLATRVEPADDAALEAHFDLGSGQLDRWRTARPHVPMWACHDQGAPVGLVRYWHEYRPDRALCFRFRATTADIAAHLLFSARVSGPLELCVIDPGVAEAMLAAGATEHACNLQMGGLL